MKFAIKKKGMSEYTHQVITHENLNNVILMQKLQGSFDSLKKELRESPRPFSYHLNQLLGFSCVVDAVDNKYAPTKIAIAHHHERFIYHSNKTLKKNAYYEPVIWTILKN